jgi:hypothetical protein
MLPPSSSPTTTPTKIIKFSTPIAAPSTEVFNALISLHGYSEWLPPSDVFHGTTSISEDPVRAGTTYIEHDLSGTRYGRVLELVDFPHEKENGRDGKKSEGMKEAKVVFHQPMRIKPESFGVVVDVLVTMTVQRVGQGSVVEREIKLGIPMILWLVRGWLPGVFEKESRRSMQYLKTYLEAKEQRTYSMQ